MRSFPYGLIREVTNVDNCQSTTMTFDQYLARRLGPGTSGRMALNVLVRPFTATSLPAFWRYWNPGYGFFLLFYVRPARASSWRCKSSRDLATGTERKRKGGRVTDRPEEAWKESMGRRTETGYEALPTRASGHRTAKLSWPTGRGVNPAVVWRRSAFLPGETSPCA